MTNLHLEVANEDIRSVLGPYVTAEADADGAEWKREVRETASRFRRQRMRRAAFGWLRRFRRTQHAVDMNYSQQWLARPLEWQVSREGPSVACHWNGRAVYARAIGLKRVHTLYMMRAIEQLQPRSVLEVGSGNGLNLFLLAARFPHIRFCGLELTAGGVEAMATVKRLPQLPPGVIAFSPESLRDVAPFDRIGVIRGSAAQLPFPDGAFDMVFTSLALEQMEEIRSAALREIRRVARAHTVMVEPFRDWNEGGIERDYVVANDYFAARIADLPAFGLEPMFATDNMPAKLTLRPGLVVCRVR